MIVTFYTGADGKKRSAKDIVIPSELAESALEQYLDDLCHEWATATQPDVRRISQAHLMALNVGFRLGGR